MRGLLEFWYGFTGSPLTAASGDDSAPDDLVKPRLDEVLAPSPSSSEDPVNTSEETTKDVLVEDYETADYRGFIYVVHESREIGMLMLHCTRKKTKPPHWQLPGGHIDAPEFIQAAQECKDRDSQLQKACTRGAARELFEETGIDVRNQLDRLRPAHLRKDSEKGGKLVNEYKHRLFFFLTVTDEDFSETGTTPMSKEGGHLKLQLSDEHSGFTFQPEPSESVEMLKLHSGGKPSEALLMAMNRDSTAKDLPAHHVYRKVGTPRRLKYEKDVELLVPPPKEDKNVFACFGFCVDKNQE